MHARSQEGHERVQTVGILHPGAMGSSIGAAAKANSRLVIWASEGRSLTSAERAHRAGLTDVGSLQELVGRCELIVSVCPPAAAGDLAVAVAGAGFSGLYLDANAISPENSLRISRAIEAGGARFVDGGIVGPPACPVSRQNRLPRCSAEAALSRSSSATKSGEHRP